MIKIRTVLLSLGALLCTLGALNAQNTLSGVPSRGLRAGASLTGFGYAKQDTNPFNVGAKENALGAAAIVLPSMPGNKIKGVSFSSKIADLEAQVFVAEQISLKDDVLETRIIAIKQAKAVPEANYIAFDSPILMEEGKTYVVGMEEMAGNTKDESAYIFRFDASSYTLYNANFLTYGHKARFKQDDRVNFSNVAYGEWGSLLIFADIEDTNGYLETALYPVDVRPDKHKSGADFKTKVIMRNLGTKAVTSTDVNLVFGLNPEAQTFAPTVSVDPAGEFVTTLSCKAVPAGLGTVKATLPKVNGKTNLFADIQARGQYISEATGGVIMRNSILLEEFTGEWCPNCPAGVPIMNQMEEELTADGVDVAVIAHHYGDPWSLSEVMPITTHLNVLFYPSMAFNRTQTTVESGGQMVESCAISRAYWQSYKKTVMLQGQQASFTKTDLVVSDDKKSFELQVEGEAYLFANPEDLNFTVLVTEDGVTPIMQTGTTDPNYKHNHLPRKYYTPVAGAPVTPNEEGKFTYTVKGNLDPSWDVTKLKLVFFLHKNLYNTHMDTRDVYVAKSMKMETGTATREILPENAPVVTVVDGYLQVLGQADSVTVFDLTGSVVAQSADTRLAAGQYVVVVSNAFGNFAHKVLVR